MGSRPVIQVLAALINIGERVSLKIMQSSSSSSPFSGAAFAFSSGDLLYPILRVFLYPEIIDPRAAKIKENWIETLHVILLARS